MSDKPSYPSVREVELAFLRKGWWLFPLLGALASLALGGPFWQWVAGDGSFSLQWQRLFSLHAGLSALAFLAIPAIWLIGLKAKEPQHWVVLVAFGAVLVMEVLLRTSWLQTPLWLASRARLDAGQSFMREVCYVRLEEAAGRRDLAPAVVLIGSSQMLHGVDDQLLRELLQPMPVIRRAMYGMTPLKALSMLAYVPFRAEDICVQYLSEFDFTNQKEFPFDWFRPYASWKTLPDVMKCVSPSVRAWHWRQGVDYALAATSECWRARDFLRQLVFHFWDASGTTATTAENVPPDRTDFVAQGRAALHVSIAEQKAFQIFAQELSNRHVRLMVFEGDVNPSIYSPERLLAKAEIRQELAGFSGMQNYRYVSREEQGLSIGAEHWLDTTHLDLAGRDMLTRRMAQELLRP